MRCEDNETQKDGLTASVEYNLPEDELKLDTKPVLAL
jgi:hypothetical protein